MKTKSKRGSASTVPSPKPPSKLSRRDFQEKFQGKQIPVASAEKARRLRKINLRSADLNRDGKIEGLEETRALFKKIKLYDSGFELGELKVLRGNTLTASGGMVQALSHLAENCEPPPAPGEPGFDPFEPHSVMPKGPYQGEPFDTHEVRSLRILAPEEAKAYGAQPGETVVANVRHDDTWWVARIPPKAIADVIVQLEYFPAPVPAAHFQTRFKFKEGQEATLVPQLVAADSKPVKVADLVSSVQATGTSDFEFNLVDGLQNKFGIAYRLVSQEDRYRDNVVAKGHRVEQIRLSLSEEEKQKVFAEALEMGTEPGLARMYNTITRSCTTEGMIAIDNGAQYDLFHDLARRMLTRSLPTSAKAYLAVRGLLSKESRMPDLADEYKPVR